MLNPLLTLSSLGNANSDMCEFSYPYLYHVKFHQEWIKPYKEMPFPVYLS